MALFIYELKLVHLVPGSEDTEMPRIGFPGFLGTPSCGEEKEIYR